MARIHRYTKGKVTLSDTLVGTDVENQKATVNIPIAAIVDLAIDYFAVNGNGDGINQSLLDITTTVDDAITSIATYQNIVNTLTNEFTSIVNRTETLESVFNTNIDGTMTISIANITNFAETIASEGFAQSTTVDSLSSQVQQIIDGQLTIDTYATIEQLAQTTSTLEGSIALLQNTLTAGYQSYADGIIQTDSFAQAVSGIVAEAGADFSQSSQWTNLLSSFGTFNPDGTLNTLSDAFANNVLSTYTGPDLATAQSVTDLGAEFGTFDANGNLTGLSSALASQITTTVAGEGYATSSDLTTLESTLTNYIDGEIASSSTAGITGSQLTSVLADYALAQTVTDLNAQIFDANGNVIDAFATSLLQTTAGNGVATAQSVTDLTATVNGNTANITTNQSAIADIDGNLSAAYGITVDAGGNIAGMQLLSDSNTGSSISFNSDVFKINVNGTDIAPFVVTANGIALNGAVTFSNASTGQGIDFDDLSNYLSTNNYATTSDIPDAFTTGDLQAYLDAQGYVTGQNALDDAQLATYLSNNNYITTATTINGGQIQTGIIASGNYQHATTPTEGFSDQGMAINLDNGSIHAEQFYINNDGSANFGGTHSAGSVGNWTVDSTGALKDAVSNPEIVLDPSGNYTEVGTEKLVLSSENLAQISPSAAVSANFTFPAGTLPNPLSSSGPGYTNYRKTASTGYQSITEGSKRYKYSYPDLTGTLPGTNPQNNIAYDSYNGGTLDYVIPYAAAPSYSPFVVTMGMQKGFGTDYGWGSIGLIGTGGAGGDLGSFNGEGVDDTGSLDFTAIPNVSGVAGIDYELKVTYRFNFVPDDLSNGLVKILFTEEKVLTSGTITKNLRDAKSSAQILTPQSDIEYFGFEFEVPNNWSAGQIAGSYTPTGVNANIGTASNPGRIDVVATYHYEITNIYIWAAQVPNTTTGEYLLNTTSQPWAYTFFTGRNYLSSGEDVFNSFTNVLFTGAAAKTNIGLNGIQLRGSKGFVALGDNVPGGANAVAQIWGNAQVVGVLTSNATELFSDKNLKDNITPISDALSTVSKLAPVSFNWKPGMRNMDLGTRYGFIAQDIQEVLPTIVREGEHLTLEHNNIISINTAAIQELVKEINKLKEEIKTLKENNG